MRRRSSIASRLAAIGRRSPWAATRFMWSSGVACSHTVVQWFSSRLKLAASDTSPPGVAMTASG